MRPSLLAFASGLALAAATPSLALTISSAPPNRDVAPHLAQGRSSAAPALRDTWAGGGRPQAGSSFSGATSYGVGSYRTWTQHSPREAWSVERRDSSSNPLALTPPRR